MLQDMPDAPPDTSDFPSRLKHAMVVSHLSVRGLSNSVNGAFATRTIFRWRSGESSPGAGALPILATALGVTTDWLLGSGEGGPDA